MIQINLLLVGDATDGPTEEIVPITNLDSAWRLFGGYQYEYTTLTSGQTSYTLGQTPWGDEVTPLQVDSDGSLIPFRLFEFSSSGTVLTWTSLGYSAPVVFRYPVVPGPTSLLKGILSCRQVPLAIHTVRLGGTSATATAGNFTLYARYAGNRYNGITLAITSGGAVTVTPSGGVGRNKLYQVTTDIGLFETLRNETQKGYQGLLIKGPFDNSTLTIPAGTYTLTGGTDGVMDADQFNTFVTDWDLGGVDVMCPVGLLTTELSGAGVLDALNENDYPTLLVAQAPASGIALSGLVISTRFLAATAFQLVYDNGLPKQRTDDAAPLVAAIIGSNIFGVTMAPLPESPAIPRYDQPSLHLLAASGYITAFRSISKDWALWQATTSDPTWPISQFRSLQEIARVAFETLEPTLGNTVLTTATLNTLLSAGFQNVQGSRIVDWNLQLQGDTLYLDVDFVPYGEVRVVNAQIAIGQQTAVSPV